MKEENDKEIEYDESALEKILKEKGLYREKSNQFVPFLKRKDVDWKDITPLEQFSPEIDILKMDYDDKFKEISNYFRAILHNNEVSLRAFNLTTELIQVNSTNYMAWYHRRQCIDQLNINLQKELDWLDDIGVINQKNYQIWHHRKVVIEKLNDPSHEKAFLDRVFEEEPKNFHAWCHRIWVVRRFNLLEGEIEYIEKMLESVSLKTIDFRISGTILSGITGSLFLPIQMKLIIQPY